MSEFPKPETQKPEVKKAARPQKAKRQKPAFEIPKLTETQWAMVAGAAFFVIYGLYIFVESLAAPTSSNIGLNAQIEAPVQETDEQKFKRENKNKLPDGSAMSKEAISEKTQATQQVPFGDNELEFRIRLPKNWVMSEFARYGLPGEEKYAVLTNIARYFGPAIEDSRPFLWVEVERQKRYMTAEAWARAYMIKRGISPQAMQVTSNTDVQVLYVDVRDFRTYAVRTLFRMVGDTMVLVSFGAPIHIYKEYKDIMAVGINSFHLIRPNERQIEKINDYKLLNVIKFKHYESWLPRNEFSESTLHPSIELHNPQLVNNEKKELLQGLILVNVWRKSDQYTHEKNMEAIKDRLQELSMTIKESLPVKELPVFNGYTSIVQSPYIAQVATYVRKDQFDIVQSDKSKTNQEIWVTTLDNGYYVAYLTLITPLKATNYVIWAQNMAAYDLLYNSIELKKAPTGD